MHNRFIRDADEASGGKLKNVAKLMKFWRLCRSPNVALSSFHIEMLLAETGICKGAKSYGQCFYELLAELARRECRGFMDPCEVSGMLSACDTEAKRDHALRAVANSRDHAKAALQTDWWGTYQEAYRQWDLVFNGHFPKA